MIVEQHAFKAQFAVGAVSGFVVRADGKFVERPGEREAYEIFEKREAAECTLAKITGDFPSTTKLCVQEVTVESVRDYQRLKGFNLIYLIDREGRAATSLRMGDMPLAARSNIPFPGPLPSGLRITTIQIEPKPAAPSSLGAKHRGTGQDDPFAHEPVDEGRNPADGLAPPQRSARPGLFTRLLRFLLGKA